MNDPSRDLLDLALRSVRDYALIVLDTEGRILEWLPGAQETFGYGPEEVAGQPVSLLFTPEDVEKGLHVHELQVAQRNSYSHDDRWHVRKDGTRIWASGTVTALRDHSGLRGFIKIMRDRTDQRINSENRANLLEATEAALQRTQQFLQTLGHELRNPLGPIRNSAWIAQRASPEPKVKTAAQTILDQVQVLERLAGDLMDVSRLHHRRLELRVAQFDVRGLLEQEVAGQKLIAVAKGVHLETLLPHRALPLVADPERLRQAVSNLVVNAVKYTPSGGSIWVKATQEGDDIVIRVQDTGIGIAPEVLPRIFELFTQESRARDLVPGGLGVGLAIVNQIAELHGGVAQARSGGSGRGSEFTLRLPRLGPPGADPPRQQSSSV